MIFFPFYITRIISVSWFQWTCGERAEGSRASRALDLRLSSQERKVDRNNKDCEVHGFTSSHDEARPPLSLWRERQNPSLSPWAPLTFLARSYASQRGRSGGRRGERRSRGGERQGREGLNNEPQCALYWETGSITLCL